MNINSTSETNILGIAPVLPVVNSVGRTKLSSTTPVLLLVSLCWYQIGTETTVFNKAKITVDASSSRSAHQRLLRC